MIIVIESPHKAPALNRSLRENFIDAKVVATNGRLFDLPIAEMGVTTAFSVERFEAVDPAHLELIHSDLLAPDLVVATDPDEEGDLIAWTIAKYRGDKTTLRAEFFDFTTNVVASAINNLSVISDQEPPALARRIFDRLLGFSGNDGMFLSRAAGALLGLASNKTLPIRKAISRISLSGSDEGSAFCERFLNASSEEVLGGGDKPGSLPRLNHLYAMTPELGVTPGDMFHALQELYTNDEISYFRTDSMTLNQSAYDALEKLSDESGFENLSRNIPQSSKTSHPGIYATRYVDSPRVRRQGRGRTSELARRLHQYICNASLFAMSDPDTRTRVRISDADKLYTSSTAECRGQIYSYPDSTYSLSDDILSGSPFHGKVEQSYDIKKETAIALSLSSMGIGHPSSWAALSKSYACLIDKTGRMSSRGVAFYHKHKSEAPALLEPDVVRAIEATLLDPQLNTGTKVQQALSLAEIDMARFEQKLTPDPDLNIEPQFNNRNLSL